MFAHCVKAAKAVQLAMIDARCSKRLVALGPPPATPSESTDESLPNAPPRPWIATRQPKTCVFSGSLEIYEPLYAAANDSESIAHLSEQVPSEVRELEPAAAPNGRMRVELAWPIRASWWLAASAQPLALVQRTDIVAKHVWLEPGTVLGATRRVKGSLDVALDLTQGGNRKVEPKNFARVVSCAQLRLASNQLPTTKARGETVLLVDQGAPLFDSPKGKVVARLVGGEFFPLQLLEHRGDFSHVAGKNGFAFDGWVESPSIVPKAVGMIGLLAPTPYTHVVKAEMPLRSQAKHGAPVVAILVRDAYVKLVSSTDEFVQVTVLGIGKFDAPTRFFLERKVFEASSQTAR
jgi:hypothetical protein